jgi:hypothetical protein
VIVQRAFEHGAIDGGIEQHAETTSDKYRANQLGEKMRPFHDYFPQLDEDALTPHTP